MIGRDRRRDQDTGCKERGARTSRGQSEREEDVLQRLERCTLGAKAAYVTDLLHGVGDAEAIHREDVAVARVGAGVTAGTEREAMTIVDQRRVAVQIVETYPDRDVGEEQRRTETDERPACPLVVVRGRSRMRIEDDVGRRRNDRRRPPEPDWARRAGSR